MSTNNNPPFWSPVDEKGGKLTGYWHSWFASPGLIGTPTAPTPTPGTNNTQIVTAEFIQQTMSTNTVNLAGLSGNVTLTATQYSGFTIVLTGALAGNINLIFPLVSNQWNVDNRTTGAFTVTAKGATGTGIVCRQGYSSLIYTDGVNVLDLSSNKAQWTDIDSATSKSTPVDADELPIADSAASFGLKKLTWANLKATLNTYFSGIFAAIAGSASQAFSMSTAAQGTNTTQGATTAFVITEQNKHKNSVINGGFDWWQRGTSFAAPANLAYVADRWLTFQGVAGRTFSRQTGFLGHKYCMRVARDNGNAVTSVFGITQIIESNFLYQYQGKTVTISAAIRAGANFSQASSAITVQAYFGTVADEGATAWWVGTWTGQTIPLNGPTTISTTAAIYSWSVAVPSNALEMAITFEEAPTGTAGAADYFEITGVQIEEGSVATEFEYRPIGHELALCQRYYQKSFPYATAPTQNAGTTASHRLIITTAGANANFAANIDLPVYMRVSPTTLTLYNPSAANAQARNANTGVDCSATAGSSLSERALVVNFTADAGALVGHRALIHWTADAEL